MLPVFWKQFTRDGKGDVRAEVGHDAETLEYIWQKYAPVLPLLLRKPEYLFLGYKYIHQYPQRENTCVLGIGSTKLHNKIIPLLNCLAGVLNEIFWEDRLDPYNHTPDFPYYVTGMVDTLPIYVQNPTNAILGHWLYNPKYGSATYKAQFGSDFLGRLTLCTVPHLGLGAYDGSIFSISCSNFDLISEYTWENTADEHPMEPWEWILGDGHYIAEPDVMTPIRQNGHLTEAELLYNAVFQHYRARIEHLNHVFNCHGAFKTAFRGGLDLMTDFIVVTAHTTNVELHRYWRYPPYGPWSHVP